MCYVYCSSFGALRAALSHEYQAPAALFQGEEGSRPRAQSAPSGQSCVVVVIIIVVDAGADGYEAPENAPKSLYTPVPCAQFTLLYTGPPCSVQSVPGAGADADAHKLSTGSGGAPAP